jgi:PDDEXK-like uncharacterized protein DUF3799
MTFPKISKPGIYDKVPMEAYHGDLCAGPSISSSGLRTIFDASPAHYFQDSYLNPDREEPEDNEAFVLGRAAHHLLLGEDAFSTLFIMRPDKFDSWRTKEAKDWKSGQEREGRTVLLPSQIKQIRGMAKALAAEPLIQFGALNGRIEQSMVWKDKETDVWLKARPDAIPNDSGDFCDLKTTVNYGFDLDKSISSLRYDMQAALVGMGVRALMGREMESFSFVFIGKKPPHTVEILTLSKDDISLAEQDLRVAINTFAWCLETGNWFGPGGTQRDARYVHISEWAKKEAEFRRDFLRREIALPEARKELQAVTLAAEIGAHVFS